MFGVASNVVRTSGIHRQTVLLLWRSELSESRGEAMVNGQATPCKR